MRSRRNRSLWVVACIGVVAAAWLAVSAPNTRDRGPSSEVPVSAARDDLRSRGTRARSAVPPPADLKAAQETPAPPGATPPGSAAVALHVIDESGAAIEGVACRATFAGPDAGRGGAEPTARGVVSGPDGRAVVRIPVGTAVRFDVSHDDFHSWSGGPVVAVADTRLAVRLRRAMRIAGRVTDEFGAGVPGALVTVSATPRAGAAAIRETVTDGEGTFNTRSVTRGDNTLRVRAAGFAEFVRFAMPVTECAAVVLRPERRVTIFTTPSPDPADVRVRMVPAEATGGGIIEDVRATGPGRFEARGLGPHIYRVVLDAGKRGCGETRVDLRSVVHGECAIDLAGGGVLKGRIEVAGAPGTPDGLRVVAEVGPDRDTTFPRETRPLADGRFEVEGVPDGHVRLRVLDPSGILTHSPDARLDFPRRPLEPVRVTLVAVAEVRGTVLDAAGRPVGGCEVVPGADGVPCEGWAAAIGVSAEDGTFRIRGVRRFAALTLLARVDGRIVGEAGPVTPRPGETLGGVEIRVARPRDMTGLVRAGDPRSQVAVTVVPMHVSEPIDDLIDEIRRGACPRGVRPAPDGRFTVELPAASRMCRLLFAWVDADGKARHRLEPIVRDADADPDGFLGEYRIP